MPILPRVLVLADHFGYAGGVVHGVTSYYLNVLPRIHRLGVELRCCFLREEHPLAGQLRDAGVPAEFLAASKWNPFVAGRIEQIVRESRSNVIHAFGMKSVLLARWVARRTGASVIIHSHDMNLPPLPVRALYRFVKLDEERGLAVSVAAANLMARAYDIDRGQVVALPNAVDVTGIHRQPAFPRPQGIPDAATILGWIGRLHAVKGPQRMIRIMATVAASQPDVHLLMVGDGPEKSACEQLVRELKLENRISLLGQRSDVSALLKQMHVLCITSLNEGFSLVAAEAAAAGVPVVAYAVGGIGEVVVDGQTGVLVPDGDATQFVAAVQGLLADESLRTTMAVQAESHSESFSMQHHVDSLMAEYQRAAQSARTRAT